MASNATALILFICICGAATTVYGGLFSGVPMASLAAIPLFAAVIPIALLWKIPLLVAAKSRHRTRVSKADAMYHINAARADLGTARSFDEFENPV